MEQVASKPFNRSIVSLPVLIAIFDASDLIINLIFNHSVIRSGNEKGNLLLNPCNKVDLLSGCFIKET